MIHIESWPKHMVRFRWLAAAQAATEYALSLRARLSLMFLTMFATVVVLGLASGWSLSHSNEVSTDVRDRWLPNVRLLGDLNNFTSDYRTAEADSLLAANNEELASQLREIPLLDQAVLRAQHDYEQIRTAGRRQRSTGSSARPGRVTRASPNM